MAVMEAMLNLVPKEPRTYTKIYETQIDRQEKPRNIYLIDVDVVPVAYKLAITSVMSIAK